MGKEKRTSNDTDGHHFFIYFLKLDTDRGSYKEKKDGKKKQYINRQDVVKLQVNLLLVLCIMAINDLPMLDRSQTEDKNKRHEIGYQFL